MLRLLAAVGLVLSCTQYGDATLSPVSAFELGAPASDWIPEGDLADGDTSTCMTVNPTYLTLRWDRPTGALTQVATNEVRMEVKGYNFKCQDECTLEEDKCVKVMRAYGPGVIPKETDAGKFAYCAIESNTTDAGGLQTCSVKCPCSTPVLCDSLFVAAMQDVARTAGDFRICELNLTDV